MCARIGFLRFKGTVKRPSYKVVFKPETSQSLFGALPLKRTKDVVVCRVGNVAVHFLFSFFKTQEAYLPKIIYADVKRISCQRVTFGRANCWTDIIVLLK